MPDSTAPDRLYIAARRVLLNGLQALGDQREAAILVGAHAVYLRVGEGDLATAPHTTDADLALDPSRLTGPPLLDQELAAAGFRPNIDDSGPNVGSWDTVVEVDGVPVHVDLDLLVPAAVSGGGTRAARLGAQGDRLARKAVGLELALLDNDSVVVGALDGDPRSFEVRVAGIAALLIAKAHRVAERIDDSKRNDFIAKDALDMLRLLRGGDVGSLVQVLTGVGATPTDTMDADVVAAIEAIVQRGIAILRSDFATPTARGCILAGRAAAGRDNPDIVAASLAALVTRLLERF